MMKTCNILCVCGSGTVSSAMVAGKLKERLKEKGLGRCHGRSKPEQHFDRDHRQEV